MDDRDIITAASVDEFPTSVGSAKENIVITLQKIQTEFEGNGWAAIKIIAKESGTSDVYTRNVMSKLLEANQAEMGRRGTKVYFRLKAETVAEVEQPED